MRIVNLVGELEWDGGNRRAGYRHRVAAVGSQLGGRLLGGSVYELPPGEKTFPYHYEVGCEEWLLVLSGRPTLRTPAGEQELTPGDLAVFPEGPAGAHLVHNRTKEPCRVLLLSSKAPVAIVHYPDSNKVQLWSQAGEDTLILRRDPNLDYWDDEDT